MIAYVANWETCPSAEQVDAYSHIVIAFAVSYTFVENNKNNCDLSCNIPSTVPICGGADANTIPDWQAAGKKVILSFGGAGMGGSWAAIETELNHCWDYCFGNEDQLSTDLVSIVQSQGFDGIDLDYEVRLRFELWLFLILIIISQTIHFLSNVTIVLL